MKPIQIFICVVALFHGTQAVIPINEVQINIFDDRPRVFEQNVIEAMNITKSFFSRDDILLAIGAGLVVATEMIPYVSKFIKIAPLFEDTVDEKSEWFAAFAKVIANETSQSIADSEIRWMSATMQTIRTKIALLDENNPDLENRKTMASIIHNELDKMINFFDLKTSIFRKYPLIGGPPLLQLASLVAIFSPIANAIIPYEAKHTQIACKMHDILNVYRPLIVYARLRKLSTEHLLFLTLFEVMSLPFDMHGHSRNDSILIECERDCGVSRPPTEYSICLRDEFSTDDYYVADYLHPICVVDYATLIRLRIEDLFPIEIMGKLCERKPSIPTGKQVGWIFVVVNCKINYRQEKIMFLLCNFVGFGWFTIILQTVYTFGKANGKPCKFQGYSGCDSHIVLFVNGQRVMKTPTEKNKFSYDVDRTYISEKIPKNATIKIEVWNSKTEKLTASRREKLIQRAEGDVSSFLEQPLRVGALVEGSANRIEIMSFWQDEYE